MKKSMSPAKQVKNLFYVCMIILISSCGEERMAQRIVDNAIQAHGGRNYENLELEFDFREYHYRMKNNGGLYAYERVFEDSLGNSIIDKLTNNGFIRTVNGDPVDLTEERENAFKSSVNSVFYFALLPYRLNDPAVKKKMVGSSSIGGVDYQVIEVTFEEKGGGEDYEDVFYFWFREDKYYMDYIAYSYNTDGGGVRFRESKNPRIESGIRFQDYNNYTPNKSNTPIHELERMFVRGELVLLSEITMDNLKVE
ncbi:DUF6503 family protein [Anditalea andensis]|uniref:Deoxyribose-phosphate aldolase n=1 Tax=Anditalea andensis TaxID=1048983 RepID=A0A074KW48_9BACT|nr:DUF6503 family protein [Anditalea andensis]KEO74191.1 hypothetical protein EL17_08625 [Anditalea andensis]